MNDIRCSKCDRLLAKKNGEITHVRVRLRKDRYQDIYVDGKVSMTCPKIDRHTGEMCGELNIC